MIFPAETWNSPSKSSCWKGLAPLLTQRRAVRPLAKMSCDVVAKPSALHEQSRRPKMSICITINGVLIIQNISNRLMHLTLSHAHDGPWRRLADDCLAPSRHLERQDSRAVGTTWSEPKWWTCEPRGSQYTSRRSALATGPWSRRCRNTQRRCR